MADKPSRALVVYGDGHASLLTGAAATVDNLNTFASLSSCGFLSLRESSDPKEEHDTSIAEFAQLLDVYDSYVEMCKQEHDTGSAGDTNKCSIPSISERFMSLRAAIFTDCSDVASLASQLGFKVFTIEDARNKFHSSDEWMHILPHLFELLGLSNGNVLEKSDYDLVFLHLRVRKESSLTTKKDCGADIKVLDKLVGAVMNATLPGSAIASRLHCSVILSYGAALASDGKCFLNYRTREINSDLLLLQPRQSYAMRGGIHLDTIRHHHPMLIAQWQDGVTRKDMACEFSFKEFLERGGNLAMLADRFLHEVAFKLWKAPKYGA